MVKGHFEIVKDTTKEEAELQHTMELARDTSYDPRPVESVEVKQDALIFDEYCIVAGFDVHAGGVGANGIREERMIDFVKNTANAFLILGGDLFNSVISPDQNQHDDKYGNQRAIDRAVELYYPIRHKIPVVIDGNHDGQDGKRFNRSNMSPSRQFAQRLNVRDESTNQWVGPKHCRFAAVIDLEIPTSDLKRKVETLSLYVTHGSGMGGTPASSVEREHEKAIAFLNQQGKKVDGEISGHFHANTSGIIPQEVDIRDEHGKVVRKLHTQAVVMSESTLQETASYSLAQGMPPVDSNVYFYIVRMARNPWYTNAEKETQPEYVMEYTRIPMFRKNSNEYTDDAKRYMEAYKEPDRNKIYAEMTRSSSTKLRAKLRRQREDYKTVKFAGSRLEGYARDLTQDDEPQVMPHDDGIEK